MIGRDLLVDILLSCHLHNEGIRLKHRLSLDFLFTLLFALPFAIADFPLL